MTDVSDIEESVDSSRRFAIADDGVAENIRMYDGIAYLLVEIIRELRDISEKLDKNAPSNA